jgi:hypothetical protein
LAEQIKTIEDMPIFKITVAGSRIIQESLHPGYSWIMLPVRTLDNHHILWYVRPLFPRKSNRSLPSSNQRVAEKERFKSRASRKPLVLVQQP